MKKTLKIAGLCIMLVVMTTSVPLYGGKLIVASNTQMDALTIQSSDEVEIQTGNTVDVDGNITITGILDMDGTSVVECSGTFTDNGTLEAASGTQITFDGTTQSITGSGSGTSNNIPFDKVVFSGGAKTFNPTTSASITNELDAGGQDVTIASDKTLTLAANSTTTISGGTWTLTGTLSPNASSTIEYTSSSAQGALDVSHGNMEHAGSGALSLPANFTVQGTYTNTSGNFTAGSYTLTAGGLVWTAGSVTATPSGAWDIGTTGIDVNGGTFLATSGTFTNAGDWDMTGATAFTPGTGTVVFDGTSAQTITSNAKPFYSLTNSNTGGTVSVADKLELNASGTMTVDASATLALAGYEFDDNEGTVTNNGTLTMDGDNTLTSGALSIGGSGTTKFTDASGATLSTGFAGLGDVEFNSSGNTFTFGEDMAYISGDITLASGSTLAMAGYDLTLADGKTVTNSGTWSAPTSGSVFTCAGAATFSGSGMNFYQFSADPGAAKTLSFADGETYTVANNLTLTGTNGNMITLQNASNDAEPGNTATISNTGGTQSVDFVKVQNVNGTASITATNSYALGGVTSNWAFSAIQFASTGAGNWNTVGTWDVGRVPVSTDNVQISHDIALNVNASIADLLVDASKTLTFESGQSRTLSPSGSVTNNGIIAINDGTLTATGASDINGTVSISTGTYDANNSFDATGGTLTFTGAASLNLADAVTSLGTMTADYGTVTYDGTTQTVFGDAYNNLSLSGGTKTLGAAITVAGDLTNASGSTLDASGSDYGISVAGDWANSGTFTARSGTVTFNGATNQALTPGTGAFNNLTLNNTGSANQSITPNAALDVDNTVTLTDGTLDLTGNYDVSIGGDLTIASGAVWTNGSGTTTFDGSGDQTLTDSNGTPNNIGTVVVD